MLWMAVREDELGEWDGAGEDYDALIPCGQHVISTYHSLQAF